MNAREELHILVDHIPVTDVAATRTFLRSLVDPVELSLALAPEDDELETEEERVAVGKARQESGPGTSHEEVLHEFGI